MGDDCSINLHLLPILCSHSGSLLMLILFLECNAVWLWAMLPMFRKYILVPPSTLKLEAACTSEISATWPTTTGSIDARRESTSVSLCEYKMFGDEYKLRASSLLGSDVLYTVPRGQLDQVRSSYLYWRGAGYESQTKHRLSWGFPGFPHSFQVNVRHVLQLGHDQFLPHLFQLTLF